MQKEIKTYFNNLKKWEAELKTLREFILDCKLVEEFKWRNPCYTDNGKNIVLIGASKDFFTLSFFKGALIKDTNNLLQKVGPNTRSAKIISFTSIQKIIENEYFIKKYIKEAIEIERKGLKVDNSNNHKLEFPKELIDQFKEKPYLEKAFKDLTKGRQRGYILHFSAAKQSKTRTSRITKHEQRILNGKGILDCICGLSKRLPNCDGSHKKAQNNI